MLQVHIYNKQTNVKTHCAELFVTSLVLVFSQGFDSFRADETLCDVVLVPGDSKERFPVHRVIMASSSDYFKAMFTGESSIFAAGGRQQKTIWSSNEAVKCMHSQAMY